MNDMELADKYERDGWIDINESDDPMEWQQIIAALRRGYEPFMLDCLAGKLTTWEAICGYVSKLELQLAERPPSGEMVMVPREPTKAMLAAGYQQYTSADKRGYSAWQDHLAVYRAMLSAAEAEGRKS